MRINKNKHTKIIISILAILIIMIVIFCSATKVIKNETISIEETKSNMGITTEDETSSWDISKLSEIVVDTSMVDSDTGETITMYVPIPSGYTASKATSEDTVIEGLVIYEGTDEVNDSNVSEAKKTRNQYVWIPANPEDVYWTNSSGERYGIYYTFSSTGYKKTNGTREPIVNSSSSHQDYCLDLYKSDSYSELEIEKMMENDFNEIALSIEKYGGFYISRYEIGDNDLKSRSWSSGTTSTAVSMQGKQVYNYLTWYRAYDLSKTLNDDNESINTTLIFGTLWDNTLNYLVESGDKTYSDLINSNSWGNYKDATFTYTNISGSDTVKSKNSFTLIPTGSTEYTKSCNIYDMAGNAPEWTLESTNYAIYVRGGFYQQTNSTVTERGTCGPGTAGMNSWGYQAGFRAVLWIS